MQNKLKFTTTWFCLSEKLVQIQHLVKRVFVVTVQHDSTVCRLCRPVFSDSPSLIFPPRCPVSPKTLSPACIWSRAEPNVRFTAPSHVTDQDHFWETRLQRRVWNQIKPLVVVILWSASEAFHKERNLFITGWFTPALPQLLFETFLQWHSFQRHLRAYLAPHKARGTQWVQCSQHRAE